MTPILDCPRKCPETSCIIGGQEDRLDHVCDASHDPLRCTLFSVFPGSRGVVFQAHPATPLRCTTFFYVSEDPAKSRFRLPLTPYDARGFLSCIGNRRVPPSLAAGGWKTSCILGGRVRKVQANPYCGENAVHSRGSCAF